MGNVSNACIFDILYELNSVCVFCNLDFSEVIELCKVEKQTPLRIFLYYTISEYKVAVFVQSEHLFDKQYFGVN